MCVDHKPTMISAHLPLFIIFVFYTVHTFFHPSVSYLSFQRKSNRAKEKKARRLEERAAMDAVCAKVDAANKVKLVVG